MDHRGDAENAERIWRNTLTDKIIGAAIEVHKSLGPGLLESAYENVSLMNFHQTRLNTSAR